MAHWQLIDIGANLTDPVFKGEYRGKQKHKVLLSSYSVLDALTREKLTHVACAG